MHARGAALNLKGNCESMSAKTFQKIEKCRLVGSKKTEKNLYGISRVSLLDLGFAEALEPNLKEKESKC